VHCKNIRISADILWRVLRILTDPVPYASASVNRRNNEAQQADNAMLPKQTSYNLHSSGHGLTLFVILSEFMRKNVLHRICYTKIC